MMKKGVCVLILFLCMFFCSCEDSDQHTVVLEFDSTTEYDFEWNVKQSDNLFEISKEIIEKEEDGKTVEKTIFTLIPKEEGLNTVRFSFKRSDEEYALREYEYAFIISEDMSVSRGDEIGNGPAPLIN